MTIEGDNLHMAGAIKSDKPVYSTGCITVPIDYYRDFGVEVGFIKDLDDNHIPAGTLYDDASDILIYGKNSETTFNGYIVIDRKYCSDDIKKKLEVFEKRLEKLFNKQPEEIQ